MLTYSLSFNKLISIPPLKTIVSSKVVGFLWNATPFISEDHSDESESEYLALTKHREQTITVANAFTEENNLPSVFKTVFKESVYSLCRAYSQVLQWKEIYDPLNEIDDLKTILLDVRNYFTADGEFDDLAWAKRVVLDPVYPIKWRFRLACYYCLENESSVLWSELKNNDLVFFNGIYTLSDIPNRRDQFITLRICQLENQYPQFADDVYVWGFREASLRNYEYATRFFWNKIAEPTKVMEEVFFRLINCTEEKIALFIYSQLTKKQKQNFLDWSVESALPYGWVVLLLYPHTEEERTKIIEMVYKLPIGQYSYILFEIAGGRYKHNFSFPREEVFKVLWNNLSPEKRGQVLEERPSLIETLIKSNQFDIVDYVIKGLSLEQKEIFFSANTLEVGDMLAAFLAVRDKYLFKKN